MAQALRTLGRSGLKVSPLCLGAMNFGNDQFGCDEKASIAIIHAYLNAGHNFIDTANVYSATKSETIVGKAVKDRRDSVVIATKASSPLGAGPFDSGSSRKHVVKACEDSLRRLGTDYIDLYQMHRYDEATPLEETLSTLNDLVRQGKVRYIGVSNWTASQIVEACLVIAAKGWEPLVSLQPQYSILARDIEVEILPAFEPRSDAQYFMLRAQQTHDIEHTLAGLQANAIGEMGTITLRIANFCKVFDAELAGELSVFNSLLLTACMNRTLLHYPQCWPAFWESMAWGTRVGQMSGPFFMARYEDLFGLPVETVRERVGIRGVEGVLDTSRISESWRD